MQIKSYLSLSEEGFHRIIYKEWGQINPNRTIICAHGLTRNAGDFDTLAQFLSTENYHLFCPDIVGRGESDWLTDSSHYTYEQYMTDMSALIARTGVEKIDWIGTSMGGIIGMALASFKKTPIRRLVLNDIGPLISLKGITRLAKNPLQDPEFNTVEDAQAYFKVLYREFGPLTEEDWQKLTERSVKINSQGKYIVKLDQRVKLASMKSKLAWRSLLHPHKALEGILFDVDLWYIWHKITCPVLVLRGKNSALLVPETLKKMCEIHPLTEVVEIDEVGHTPALADALQLKIIKDWLNKTSS